MALFSSESKSQQTTDPMRRDQVVGWQNRMYGLMDRPFQFFPGQTYADMDPLQQEALQQQEAYARGMGGMVDPAMQAWQSTLTAPDVANNQYVQAMLGQQADLLNRNLFENLIPEAEMGAIAAGQFGGSRQGIAEGIAMRGTQEALARQAASTQMDAYLAGLGQQRYGISAAPGMASFGMTPSTILSDVGAVQRSEAQRAIDEEMARFQFAQEEPWRRLERFAGTYFPASEPYSTTTTEQQYTPSAFQVGSQLAGLGMSGYGLYRGLQNPMGYGGYGYGMPPAYGGYQDYWSPQSMGFRGAYS